ELVRIVRDDTPAHVVISTHCHNDLGLAVANALAGIENGARQVEVAVNGIGERAGNCSLEEIAMIVRTRGEHLGVQHGVNIKEITRTSRLVSMTTGYSVQPNKAVVGASAFAHESGIHQHGVLANRATYEIMDPLEIGLEGNQLVLGKHSGRHAFVGALDKLGITLDDGAVQADVDGRRVTGRGVATDVVEASARAYLAAVNRALAVAAKDQDRSNEVTP